MAQIPLQFHCIFYRQPTVNIFLQFLHSIFALFVCKKCSETAVGFVHSEKPVLPLQILAVWCMAICVCVCSTFLYIVLSGSSLHSQHTVVAAAGMSYIRVIAFAELPHVTFIHTGNLSHIHSGYSCSV